MTPTVVYVCTKTKTKTKCLKDPTYTTFWNAGGFKERLEIRPTQFGIAYKEPGPKNSKLQWIDYATEDGKSLSGTKKEEMYYRILSYRQQNCKHPKEEAGDKKIQANCTEEAFQNFPNTNKFVEFAKKYVKEQESYKKCLFKDDVRRGVLSGNKILDKQMSSGTPMFAS